MRLQGFRVNEMDTCKDVDVKEKMDHFTADFTVPSLFDDLSDVELAYVFADRVDADASKAARWMPLPSFDPRPLSPVPCAKTYHDAEEEVFKRMYAASENVGEVELFLRTCLEFFGKSWQTLRELRFVAYSYLELQAAKELTTPQLMAKCGPSAYQGTWFPYWQVGFQACPTGEKEYKYRLSPVFFGAPSTATESAKKD